MKLAILDLKSLISSVRYRKMQVFYFLNCSDFKLTNAFSHGANIKTLYISERSNQLRFYLQKNLFLNNSCLYGLRSISDSNYKDKYNHNYKNFINFQKKMFSGEKQEYKNKIVKTKLGDLPFLNADDSRRVDELLMGAKYCYSIDQLIEVAGLTVAKAIDQAISTKSKFANVKNILSISGPGSI